VDANAKPYEYKYKAVFNDWDDAKTSPSKPPPIKKPGKPKPPEVPDWDDVIDGIKESFVDTSCKDYGDPCVIFSDCCDGYYCVSVMPDESYCL
jgi:hypothetical protein